MNILSCNAGSTSLKFQLFRFPEKEMIVAGKIERIGSLKASLTCSGKAGNRAAETVSVSDHMEAVALMLSTLRENGTDDIDAAAFKTVMAGDITLPCVIDRRVMDAMREYLIVAPLHNRVYLDIISAFREQAPNIKCVGVFEPFFHQTVPAYARIYAVPYEWIEKYGIHKYGYHGASHRYISERIAELLPEDAASGDFRVLSCHLGGSSSVCSLLNGISTDISSGFSPQSGIAMGTRVGDLDVYAVLYLLQKGMSPEEINEGLFNRGGIKGISGISEDMRDLEAASMAGNERAKLALDLYSYDVRRYIGAFIATSGMPNALVFTGGIGENSSYMRSSIIKGLAHLGFELDGKKNSDGLREQPISAPKSRVKIFIVPTNEEIVIAGEAYLAVSKDS